VGALASVLRRLADAGNAVVVVEHDPLLIAAADHVIDLGPGPGQDGGEVVYAGPVSGLVKAPRSKTGDALAGRIAAALPAVARREAERPASQLVVRGACENNLQDLTVAIPLNRLVCV